MEDDETRGTRRQARSPPGPKYKVMMQKLADRKIDEVLIDLDDLASVSCSSSSYQAHGQ